MTQRGTSQSAQQLFTSPLGLIVPVSFIMLIVVLLLPVPPLVIDVLIAVNLSLSLLILFIVVYVSTPLEFSVFPSLLLMVTLYRLILNVATTRLILSNTQVGEGASKAAGEIIGVFGRFVIGNSLIVGFIIFCIFTIFQLLVITRGASRISEVAARFMLDALPGRQMSIDSDLSAGSISDAEARMQRAELAGQSDFYGAMDGASKFVRGDAIASFLIIVVNIVGGFLIGVLSHGMNLGEAARVFTTLTIGDGLVNQVPALLVAFSAGLLITRTTSRSTLPAQLAEQIAARPVVFYVIAAVLAVLGLATELPPVPLVGVAVACLAGGAFVSLRAKRAEARNGMTAEDEETARETMSGAEGQRRGMEALLDVDAILVEVGYGLVGLVDPELGGRFAERVGALREELAQEMGLVVPSVRIRDSLKLRRDAYDIKFRGLTVARGSLKADGFLALERHSAGNLYSGLEGYRGGLAAEGTWVSLAEVQDVRREGKAVFAAEDVLLAELGAATRLRAPELVTRQMVEALVERVRRTTPRLVEEVVPGLLTMGQLQKVLQNLVSEDVTIRPLDLILETLAEAARETQDPDELAEVVRQALGRYITARYVDDAGVLHCARLAPELEEHIEENLERLENEYFLTLGPQEVAVIRLSITSSLATLSAEGRKPVLVCGPTIRRHLKKILRDDLPGAVVLSYNEIAAGTDVGVGATAEKPNGS